MKDQGLKRMPESFCFGDGRYGRVVGPSLESVAESRVIRPQTAVARQLCLAPSSQLGFSIPGSSLYLDLMAELLSAGTSVRFRPNGRSMYPSIQDGEVVAVEPVEPSDVKRGDIVLYRFDRSTPTQSSSGVIAHRVVQVNRSKGSQDALVFRLQGDASSSCDEPVEARQILGRVVRVERNGRSVALASRGAKTWHQARRWASRLKRVISTQLRAANQTFTVGDAATAGSTITVTDHTTTPTIRAANDIGIPVLFPLNGSGTSVTPTQVCQS